MNESQESQLASQVSFLRLYVKCLYVIIVSFIVVVVAVYIQHHFGPHTTHYEGNINGQQYEITSGTTGNAFLVDSYTVIAWVSGFVCFLTVFSVELMKAPVPTMTTSKPSE